MHNVVLYALKPAWGRSRVLAGATLGTDDWGSRRPLKEEVERLHDGGSEKDGPEAENRV